MCAIDWAMVLEYLRVLLSWPVVVGVLGVMLFWRHAPAIAGKLSGIREVKYPGGSVNFDPAEAQTAAVGEGSRSLNLPHASANPGTPPSQVNRAISQRTRSLLADGAQSLPQLEAALDYVQQNPGPSIDTLTDALFNVHCEKAYAAIFGTQLLSLEYLTAKGPEASLPLSELSSFIQEHARRAAAHGQTPLSDEQFIGFLQRHLFVRDVGQAGAARYRATYTGAQFLVYIKATYPLSWNGRGL